MALSNTVIDRKDGKLGAALWSGVALDISRFEANGTRVSTTVLLLLLSVIVVDVAPALAGAVVIVAAVVVAVVAFACAVAEDFEVDGASC